MQPRFDRRRNHVWPTAFLVLVVSGCSRKSYREPSGSMEPTLHVGQHFQAEKLSGPPQRGQVVVVKSPRDDHALYAKRVEAVGGDTIEIRLDQLVVNDKPVRRCVVGHYAANEHDLAGQLVVEYAGDTPYLVLYSDEAMGLMKATPPKPAFTVPAGEVFVLGDNRFNSLDSSTWSPDGFTALPVSDVTSQVIVPGGPPTLPADAPKELVAALSACLHQP